MIPAHDGTGRPVPFTLTPKAHALLDQVPDGQWACEQCGAACFGTPPDGRRCPGCAEGPGRDGLCG
jgi:hypothetical protein